MPKRRDCDALSHAYGQVLPNYEDVQKGSGHLSSAIYTYNHHNEGIQFCVLMHLKDRRKVCSYSNGKGPTIYIILIILPKYVKIVQLQYIIYTVDMRRYGFVHSFHLY